MKTIVAFMFIATVTADHGHHTASTGSNTGYGAAVIPTAAPIRSAGYDAATPIVTPVRAAEVEYIAPTTGYDTPATGYAAAERVLRTESVSSPGAKISYNVGWSAPAYQRLVFKRNEGYAPTSGYAAPTETYAAPSESYGAPTVGSAAPATTYGGSSNAGELVERTELVPAGESKAFIKFEQNIEASAGTRTLDAEGNTIEETYADSTPNFRYAYGVEDQGSGDVKLAQEERHGDNVRGSYSFMQPDGCQRTVNYFTDEIWNEVQYVVEYRGPGCAERYELPAPAAAAKLDANMFNGYEAIQAVKASTTQ